MNPLLPLSIGKKPCNFSLSDVLYNIRDTVECLAFNFQKRKNKKTKKIHLSQGRLTFTSTIQYTL